MTETLLMVLWLVLVGEQSVGAGLTAQESEGHVIVISPRVGEVIDAEERERFNLFPGVPGFQRAVFLLRPDSTLVVRVTLVENGEERTRLIHLPKTMVATIGQYIDRDEGLQTKFDSLPPRQPPDSTRQDPLAKMKKRIRVRDRVVLTLHGRLTPLSGRVLEVADSSLSLSIPNAPSDLVSQQSLPVTGQPVAMTIDWNDIQSIRIVPSTGKRIAKVAIPTLIVAGGLTVAIASITNNPVDSIIDGAVSLWKVITFQWVF